MCGLYSKVLQSNVFFIVFYYKFSGSVDICVIYVLSGIFFGIVKFFKLL